MLIVDMPCTSRDSGRLRVGVIGSCRARDTFYEAYQLDPALRSSAGAPECPLVWYRYSAFTHTLPQALQYHRIVSGDLEIPEDLQPCILFNRMSDGIRKRLSSLTPELTDSIDLYAVEVSTFGELVVGDYSLHASYVEPKLVRAGGKPLLNWWRSVSTNGDAHAEVVAATLAALPSREIEDNATNRWIIEEGRLVEQSDEAAGASLRALRQRLDRPLLLMPAFNTPTKFSQARATMIERLDRLATTEGCHFFDPTSVVAAAGHEVALKGGVDTMHYAKGFHYSLLKAVVPFLDEAVSTHRDTGRYIASRYPPLETDARRAA